MKPCTHEQLKHRADALWRSAKRPVLRRTMNYELSVFPSGRTDDTAERTAILRFGSTRTCPVWRVLLIAAVVALTAALAWRYNER